MTSASHGNPHVEANRWPRGPPTRRVFPAIVLRPGDLSGRLWLDSYAMAKASVTWQEDSTRRGRSSKDGEVRQRDCYLSPTVCADDWPFCSKDEPLTWAPKSRA